MHLQALWCRLLMLQKLMLMQPGSLLENNFKPFHRRTSCCAVRWTEYRFISPSPIGACVQSCRLGATTKSIKPCSMFCMKPSWTNSNCLRNRFSNEIAKFDMPLLNPERASPLPQTTRNQLKYTTIIVFRYHRPNHLDTPPPPPAARA